MPGSSFSIELTVVTNDKLKKITLKLVKAPQDDGSVDWSLDFTLADRKKTTDQFEEVINLKVKVKPAHAKKAEATFDKKSLDSIQTSQTAVAAEAAKLLDNGQISKKTAEGEVQRIIGVRAG